MMDLPLIGGDATLPLIRFGQRAQSGLQFLASAQVLAQRLPAHAPLLNLCESRYSFMLGFCATLLRGGINLLPPGAAPDTLRQIAAAGGAVGALAERAELAAGLPWHAVPAEPDVSAPYAGAMPGIEPQRVVAIAYTSGSTGAPVAHPKSWGALVHTARLATARFLSGLARPAIVGTVPPQHMYGLETTVMFALVGAATATPGRPFFPADIATALSAVPAPRLLITTPVHLRACVASAAPLKDVAKIISATAPLPRELAQAVEQQGATEVHEIYGCTEAGSMASRRTVAGEYWQPYPGLTLCPHELGAEVRIAHLDQTVQVQDLIETAPDGRFRLLGRAGDLLKVAGKRMSLADLTARLLSIKGVEDAVVFQAADDALVQRPAALVVAPGLSEAQVLDALAAQVDAVFLPRPLRKVAQLPRNAVGKLPIARLRELLAHG